MRSGLFSGAGLLVLSAALAGCGAAAPAATPATTQPEKTVAAVAATAAPVATSGDTALVVSYNSPAQWANWGAVLAAFTTETGISAPSDPKNSGQTLAALEAEAAAPQADTAYYGIVFGIDAAEKGLVDAYQPDGFADIPTALKDADGRWMTVHQGTVAFLVNTEELGGAPVPQCWADLLKPEYKDKVGFLDPTQAAVGYSVLTAANLALGGTLENFDPGMDYFSKLYGNGLNLPAQTATAMVQQGEIPILVDADFNGYKLRNIDQAPVEVVIPCEGSIPLPYVMSLVKDAPRAENGRALLDFALSDAGQQLFAKSYLRPIRAVAVDAAITSQMLPDSAYAKVINPDFAQMRAVQKATVQRWQDEVVK